ncbi:hypothetical protein Q0P45_13935, partial [Staphylococcus aureus]|nr:hypothetical protein [Staphylococcus aureus]
PLQLMARQTCAVLKAGMATTLTVQEVDETLILTHALDLLADDPKGLCTWDVASQETRVGHEAIREEPFKDGL